MPNVKEGSLISNLIDTWHMETFAKNKFHKIDWYEK